MVSTKAIILINLSSQIDSLTVRTSTGSSAEGSTNFDWRHKLPWSIAHRHSLLRLISQPAFAVFKLMNWLCVGWYCTLCRYFVRGSCFSPVSNVILDHGLCQSWYWDDKNIVRRRLSWQEADSFTEGKNNTGIWSRDYHSSKTKCQCPSVCCNAV